MDHFNAIRGTVTSGGTGNLTVSTTGTGKGRPLSTIPVGTSVALRFDDPNGVDWELSMCTMLTSTTLSRDTLLASSNGSKINFAAGTIALQTVVAEQLNNMLSVGDIPFSAAIPLIRPGNSYMASKTINAALTLTPAASAVRGALVYLRVIADGANVPNYSAFKEWGGSMGYDNRNGVENQMQFFYDGSNYWVSISQAVGAVGVTTAPGAPTIGAASSTGATTANVAFAAPASNGGSAVTGYTVTSSPAGGTDSNAGGTGLTHAMTGLTTGTAYTFTVTATNNVGTGPASSASNSVTPVAAAPAAPSIVATSGNASASVTITAGSGGVPTGYSVTSNPAGGVDPNPGATTSPRVITGLTNGTAYTFTATATNATGTSSSSAASNSVVPAVPSSFVRLSPLTSDFTESGTGPYTYTSTASTGSTVPSSYNVLCGGIATQHRLASTDGSLAMKVTAFSLTATGAEPMLGVQTGQTVVKFNTLPYALFGRASSNSYVPITSGTIGTPTTVVQPLTNDLMRMSIVGTTLLAQVSQDNGATWTTVYTWTGVPTSALYFQCMVAGGGVGTMSALTGVGLG